MAILVDRIDHVEVFVQDLEASIRWYAQVLGLHEVYRWDPEPVMIGVGDTKLALFKSVQLATAAPAGQASRAPHWHRVAWRTSASGFEQAQEHLRNLGVAFRGPIDHGAAFSIYFHDPDGNPLEITYYI